MNNKQTGGGLAPANWTGKTPLTKAWKGGFLPPPQSIYPAIRDTKLAIRWLRSQATTLNIDTEAFASAGWSAGACTSVFLASQFANDFVTEMDQTTDPTFETMLPSLHLSSKVSAGVVWAGNGVATDTYDSLDGQDRFSATTKTPLAMYRGAKDGTMTPWAQSEVQAKFNASGGEWTFRRSSIHYRYG
jgi:dienelactone hydrolase